MNKRRMRGLRGLRELLEDNSLEEAYDYRGEVKNLLKSWDHVNDGLDVFVSELEDFRWEAGEADKKDRAKEGALLMTATNFDRNVSRFSKAYGDMVQSINMIKKDFKKMNW